jgi:ankyrin repeat protein
MDFEKELLHFAAADGNLEKVKRLIEDGFDVNSFEEDLSFTPLHYAVIGAHLDVANYLILKGADVNAHDEERIGETPLDEVAASCSYEVAEALIKAGANPIIKGWMHITALDRASKRKKPEGRRVYELLFNEAVKKYNHKT